MPHHPTRLFETWLTDEDDVIAEGSSRPVFFDVVDDDGAVAGSELYSMTATLYVKSSGAIINSRDQQDILNINGGQVDESGQGSLLLDPADNVIVAAAAKKDEDHELLIEWEDLLGNAGKHLIHLRVGNLEKVPAA